MNPLIDPRDRQLNEIRQSVQELRELIGPGLRMFLDQNDLPFRTVNALMAYGEKLLKGIVSVQDAIRELSDRHHTGGGDDTPNSAR